MKKIIITFLLSMSGLNLCYAEGSASQGDMFNESDLKGIWHSNLCDTRDMSEGSKNFTHEFIEGKMISTYYKYSDSNCTENQTVDETITYSFELGPETVSETGVKVRHATVTELPGGEKYSFVLTIIDNVMFIGGIQDNKLWICGNQFWQGFVKQPYDGPNDIAIPACPVNENGVLKG